jgi:hypothetical protein
MSTTGHLQDKIDHVLSFIENHLYPLFDGFFALISFLSFFSGAGAGAAARLCRFCWGAE